MYLLSFLDSLIAFVNMEFQKYNEYGRRRPHRLSYQFNERTKQLTATFKRAGQLTADIHKNFRIMYYSEFCWAC